VSRIFEAVPVRKKFLRSPATEQGACLDVVLRAALAHPRVRFRVTASGKDLLNLPATDDPAERSALVLGPDFAGQVLPLQGAAGGASLCGFVSRPERTRSSTKQMLFFVNGRYVRDTLLHQAVMAACRRRIEARRYPSVILFLELAPAEVDVNVHPAKMEVKFRKPGEIFQLVHDGVERALSAAFPDLASGGADSADVPPSAGSGRVAEALRRYMIRGGMETRSGRGASAATATLPLPPSGAGRLSGPDIPVPPRAAAGGARGPWSYLGQAAGTYLIFGDADGLLVVDQHAAHERLLYERLRRREQGRQAVSQRLLVPEVVALPRRELGVLLEHASLLEEAGILLEPFGGDAVVVKALPGWLEARDIRSFLLDLAEDMSGDRLSGREVAPLRERMLVFLACRGAVKANREMEPEEARALLADLGEEPQAATCPHGRPVAVRFGAADLEKLFHRR
jgi:DNA mismatch repair protein MutL